MTSMAAVRRLVRSLAKPASLALVKPASLSTASSTVQYECLAEPAAGSPFHHAFPVHCLDAARAFYGGLLGCPEGRSSAKWVDFSLHGHQIVAHWVGNDYRCIDYYNPVDGDEVSPPQP